MNTFFNLISMQLEVIDHAIYYEKFEIISRKLMSAQFPWYWSENVNEINDRNTVGLDDFQFTHLFYAEEVKDEKSLYYDILTPLIELLNPKHLIRIKANLITKNNQIIEHGFHTDNGLKYLDALTAIYYVNNNNGYTVFKNGVKVNSVANRLLVFPAIQEHSGTTCTDSKNRVIINFNFIPN